MVKHEIKCSECGLTHSVDYETTKRAERGELFCDFTEAGCNGWFKRVWGATGHIWKGDDANGIDLG